MILHFLGKFFKLLTTGHSIGDACGQRPHDLTFKNGVENGNALNPPAQCLEHKEEFKLFCAQDRTLLCVVCYAISHSGHPVPIKQLKSLPDHIVNVRACRVGSGLNKSYSKSNNQLYLDNYKIIIKFVEEICKMY